MFNFFKKKARPLENRQAEGLETLFDSCNGHIKFLDGSCMTCFFERPRYKGYSITWPSGKESAQETSVPGRQSRRVEGESEATAIELIAQADRLLRRAYLHQEEIPRLWLDWIEAAPDFRTLTSHKTQHTEDQEKRSEGQKTHSRPGKQPLEVGRRYEVRPDGQIQDVGPATAHTHRIEIEPLEGSLGTDTLGRPYRYQWCLVHQRNYDLSIQTKCPQCPSPESSPAQSTPTS